MKIQAVVSSKTSISCLGCHARKWCWPPNISDFEIEKVNRTVYKRSSVKKGTALITAGMAFHSIYAIRTGFFKTSIRTGNGQEHLLGFQMMGDSLGMDGFAAQKHNADVIALEDSDICAIPTQEVENLSRTSPIFQRHFLQILGKEIVREHQNLLMLSQMSAEVRVARFLNNLTDRLGARGFSQSEVLLRMTREEIGQYLGLKLETVSRTFSKLSGVGVLAINRRHVRILDQEALSRAAGRAFEV